MKTAKNGRLETCGSDGSVIFSQSNIGREWAREVHVLPVHPPLLVDE